MQLYVWVYFFIIIIEMDLYETVVIYYYRFILDCILIDKAFLRKLEKYKLCV